MTRISAPVTEPSRIQVMWSPWTMVRTEEALKSRAPGAYESAMWAHPIMAYFDVVAASVTDDELASYVSGFVDQLTASMAAGGEWHEALVKELRALLNGETGGRRHWMSKSVEGGGAA